MRYYAIEITPQEGGGAPQFAWGSHPDGIYDPGALNVEFDMPVAAYGTPMGGQTITIEGISLQDISQRKSVIKANPVSSLGQSGKFSGANIVIRGGMQKGLPLANPSQAGVLVAGQIFQSFGNWEGTEMKLNFVVYPAVYTMDDPGNIVLNWTVGQSLSDALKSMLSIAYPGMPISINIGSNLVLNTPFHSFHSTLDGVAQMIGDFTEGQFNGQRVNITIQCGKIVVYDRTYKPNPIQINFTDMIGQPTWIEPLVMQVNTVMRADLQVGSIITMPKDTKNGPGIHNVPGLVNTSAASFPSSIRYESAFQNNFQVKEIRHIGNFRSSDSSEWASVFNCVPLGPLE